MGMTPLQVEAVKSLAARMIDIAIALREDESEVSTVLARTAGIVLTYVNVSDNPESVTHLLGLE